MEGFSNQEKGLFTFYRQQADFQQYLNNQRQSLKKQHQEESLKQKGRNFQLKREVERKIEASKKYSQREASMDQPNMIQLKQSKKKENEQKIIELLEKNKYKKSRGRMPRMIETNNQISKKNSKMQLQIYRELQDKQLKETQKFCKYRKDLQEDILATKRDLLVRKTDPFQKLAIQPVYFESQIEQKPTKLTKNEEPGAFRFLNSIKNRYHNRYQQLSDKELRVVSELSVSHPMHSQLLPKIDEKANLREEKREEQLKKKMEKYVSYQLRSPSKFQERQIKAITKKKRDLSLNIEKSQNLRQQTNSKGEENLNLHVFVQKKESKASQEIVKQEKQRVLMEILMKLKFK